MTKNVFFIAIGLFISYTAIASPAAWYLWKSKANGQLWCTQTLPGEGWLKLDGPYKDAHCTTHGRPH